MKLFGYRTIKTAIATPIAVFIAQLLGISNIVSAGILTILCIQPSRKKSIVTAWERLAANIIAIFFAIVFFETFGYSPLVLGLILAFFIPTTVLLKVDNGILTASVILLNIFHFGTVKVDFIFEQLTLIGIGIGTGLLVNLYMPSLDQSLHKLQKELEENFKNVLAEIALYLREGRMDWDGKEFNTINDILEKAKELVERDKENHFSRTPHMYEQYFTMRKRQFSHLKQMLPLVARISTQDKFALKLGDYFAALAEAVHPGDTAIIYLQQLYELHEEFKAEALPTTQEEFETRASLFQLLYLLEAYLEQKNNYYKKSIHKKRSWNKFDSKLRPLKQRNTSQSSRKNRQ